MQKNERPPVETRFKDLTGNISVNLKEANNFEQLAAELAGYNPDRFELVAIRVFLGDKEHIVTVYAMDKEKKENWNKPNKIPVHKFKMQGNLQKILPMIEEINFTLVIPEGHDLENMEVINK